MHNTTCVVTVPLLLLVCLDFGKELMAVYTAPKFWQGTDKTGTSTIFVHAGTTYLHCPSVDEIGTGACLSVSCYSNVNRPL